MLNFLSLAMLSDECTPSSQPSASIAPTDIPSLLSCLPKPKKIRLKAKTGADIQVFEVQAVSSGNNIAKNKRANQSSTYRFFSASRAVDGNMLSFSHTRDMNAWWEVDLGDSFPIENVVIFNRWCRSPQEREGCLCRLSNATLSLLDSSDSVILSVPIGNVCGKLVLEYVFDTSPEFCSQPKMTVCMLVSYVSTSRYISLTILSWLFLCLLVLCHGNMYNSV